MLEAKLKELALELNETLGGRTPQEVIQFVFSEFGTRAGFASSLGAEDQVITDMIAGIDTSANIFTLDTGRMFPETYDLLDLTSKKYKMKIQVFFPDAAKIEDMVRNKGVNLFYDSVENRKLCCHIRKIEPLNRALKDLDVWISGLRKEQSVTRKDLQLVEWDKLNGKIKVNPLHDWTEQDVWDYIEKNAVPYNLLHKRGYPSIGCQPCTRAIQPGEDIRAGRWWWENPDLKECGLHKR